MYTHRSLDSLSLHVKRDLILSPSLTENPGIASGEVLNCSLPAFTFLDASTGFKGTIKHARIFLNHEI